jgi:hypothetical protein
VYRGCAPIAIEVVAASSPDAGRPSCRIGRRVPRCASVTEGEQRERIGRALRALATDLAAEKRRVMLLRRENEQLRAELAALRGEAEADATPQTGRSASPSPAG